MAPAPEALPSGRHPSGASACRGLRCIGGSCGAEGGDGLGRLCRRSLRLRGGNAAAACIQSPAGPPCWKDRWPAPSGIQPAPAGSAVAAENRCPSSRVAAKPQNAPDSPSACSGRPWDFVSVPGRSSARLHHSSAPSQLWPRFGRPAVPYDIPPEPGPRQRPPRLRTILLFDVSLHPPQILLPVTAWDIYGDIQDSTGTNVLFFRSSLTT